MEKEIHRFRKDFQIWKACAKKGDNREKLEYVCFEGGYAYASDGHILAKVNVRTLALLDDDGYDILNGYCIHADALKVLTHYENIEIVSDGENISFVCHIRKNTMTFGLTPKKEVNPPDFEAVLKAEGEHVPIEKIGIEKTYLNDLTDAIGLKRVKMDFYSESSKIIVTPINDDFLDVKGLIMPIMTTGSLDL